MKTIAAWLVSAMIILPASAKAATVLSVDLTTTNQITISATGGASAATVTGSDFIGVYLDGLFGGNGFLSSSLVSGNLTNANNAPDNTPLLYRGTFSDPGLNIYSFSTATNVNFTAGTQAFVGTATWQLNSLSYNNLLSGATTGSIFFAADTANDRPGATIIGEWALATVAPVPLPAPVLLLMAALFGLGALTRRKKQSHLDAIPA